MVNKLSDMAYVIEALDGYRVGRNTSIERVEEKIRRWRDVEKSLPKWHSIRRDIDALLNLPLRDPYARKLSNIFLLIRSLLGILGVTFSFGLVSVALFPHISTPLIYTCMVALLFMAIARWYVLNKILDYYEREISCQLGKVRRLRTAVDSLIRKFKEDMKKGNIPAKKYRLHLFNTDYASIKILKKPGWIRDYYVCEVDVCEVGEK